MLRVVGSVVATVLISLAVIVGISSYHSTPRSSWPPTQLAAGHKTSVVIHKTSVITHFETSCDPAVAERFDRALSMLYSFEYGQARQAFEWIARQDPSCCIAHFMVASSYTHPIWSFISDGDLARTQDESIKATQCAQQSPRISPRERAYISALAVYANTTDPAVADPAARLQAYADAMERQVYPFASTDINAGILFGLSLLAVGYYSEHEPAEGFPHLTAAGRIEEQMIGRDPHAPGALHYAVHAYDQPETATKALGAAHGLAQNAQGVPHAIHMPSHIWSDRGLWNLSVAANMESLNRAHHMMPDFTGPDWFHGAYFLQFALLQLAMDCDARALVGHFQQLAAELPQVLFAHLESASRVPVMLLFETRDWQRAAGFELETHYNSSGSEVWDTNIWTRIYAGFANVVGRAVLDQPAARIEAAVAAIQRANQTLCADGSWRKYQMPYWRLSFEIMVRAAAAWKLFRVDAAQAGIDAMHELCAFQARSWHPEVGHTWDCHEQLAEMFTIRSGPGDLKGALAAYELAHRTYPNRYGSMAGAARSARMLGDRAKACSYYSQLARLTAVKGLPAVSFDGLQPAQCPAYSPDRRPELAVAHAYLRDECDSSHLSILN